VDDWALSNWVLKWETAGKGASQRGQQRLSYSDCPHSYIYVAICFDKICTKYPGFNLNMSIDYGWKVNEILELIFTERNGESKFHKFWSLAIYLYIQPQKVHHIAWEAKITNTQNLKHHSITYTWLWLVVWKLNSLDYQAVSVDTFPFSGILSITENINCGKNSSPITRIHYTRMIEHEPRMYIKCFHYQENYVVIKKHVSMQAV